MYIKVSRGSPAVQKVGLRVVFLPPENDSHVKFISLQGIGAIYKSFTYLLTYLEDVSEPMGTESGHNTGNIAGAVAAADDDDAITRRHAGCISEFASRLLC